MADFEDRLRKLRIEIDDETRAAHLAATNRALAEARRARRFRRGRVIPLLVAALLVLQVGVVWAAETSVPGDLLYAVKRAFETPRAVVDRDVQLRHRVEEAEQLDVVEGIGGDRITDLIREADRVRTDQSDTDLVGRLEQLRQRHAVDEPTRDVPSEHEPPTDDPPTNTDRPTDRPARTTTTTEPAPADRPTDTTTPHRDTTTTTAPAGDGSTSTTMVRDRRGDTTTTTMATDAPPTDG